MPTHLKFFGKSVLKSKAILASSDGSVKNNKGTFGLVIKIDEITKFTNKGTVPTPWNGIKSHRTEVFGLLTLIRTVTRTWDQGVIEVFCDNSAAVRSVFSTDFIGVNRSLSSNMDLILACRKIIKTTNLTIRGHWIKGHPNLDKALSIPQTLNIEADDLANQAM